MLLPTGLLVVATASGTDWPEWRGPNRDSISSEKISAAWPAGGPKVLWRASVGKGFSSVAISQGRAYTMGNTNELDTIWCLDALSGKPLWQHSYPARLGPQYYEGGPGATPTVTADRVFTINKWGEVFCLDAGKGTVLWHHNLAVEGIRSNRWGFAGSPLVWHHLLLLNAGTTGTALEINTGRTAWFNGTNPAGYASPVLFSTGSGKESVLIFAAKYLAAVEPQSGRFIWQFPFETGYDVNNTDPIIHQNRIFISSYSRGCALLAIKDNQPELLYANKNLRSHLSPGILLDDYLYAFNGEAKTETDFRCIHLPSGEIKWATKDPANGAVIGAGGQLLILSEPGELLLARPSPKEFKTLARAKVLDPVCWTPPTLANGLLYARNSKGDLVCLDFR